MYQGAKTGCDCSTCNRLCSDRRVGMGYVSPTFSSGGIGTSLIGSVASLVPAGNLVAGLISTIGSLFGAAPRGNLQKFQRTAYPYMRTLASRSGVPVYIGWFGEAVRVNPDGSYGAYGDMTHYEARLESNGETPFYAATCPHSDCVNKPQDLQFELHDPDGVTSGIEDAVYDIQPSTGGGTYTPTGGGTLFPSADGSAKASIFGNSDIMLPLLIAGGIVAFAAFGGDKRRKA